MAEQIKIISVKEYLKNHKKSDQEEIWDSIAIPWGKYVVKTVPIVEEFLKDKKGLVIDLGCGSGRNMIKNEGLEHYGVDFSSGQLAHAMEYAKDNKIKAKFFKLSADKLSKKDFKNDMFDYGLFIATLHCLDTSIKRKNSLKELYRVLKPNAQGIITVWNSENPRFKCVNNSGDIYMSWKEEGVPYMRYYYLYKKEEFLKLVESVGFKIIEFYTPREHDRFSRKNWIVKLEK